MAAEFVPIPDFPRYEINRQGVVRNAKTKKPLRLFGGCYQMVVQKYKVVTRARDKLTAVFDEAADKWFVIPAFPNYEVNLVGDIRHRRGYCVPVILQRDDRTLSFETIRDAAKFLAETNFFAFPTIAAKFTRREKFIFGWQVTYVIDPELRRALGRKARELAASTCKEANA